MHIILESQVRSVILYEITVGYIELYFSIEKIEHAFQMYIFITGSHRDSLHIMPCLQFGTTLLCIAVFSYPV